MKTIPSILTTFFRNRVDTTEKKKVSNKSNFASFSSLVVKRRKFKRN